MAPRHAETCHCWHCRHARFHPGDPTNARRLNFYGSLKRGKLWKKRRETMPAYVWEGRGVPGAGPLCDA